MEHPQRAIAWQELARRAIENGCQSVGELLVTLALAHLQPGPEDVREISRVFAEHDSTIKEEQDHAH